LKLRYLKIADYPPLSELALAFSTTSPLARRFSMHFVVGVNGTGKTHFLQALCEIFLALSDWRLPHFPCALVYELGASETTVRTVVLDTPGNRSSSSLWLAEGFGFPSDTSTEAFTSAILSLRSGKDLALHGLRPLIAPGTWPSGSSTPNLAALPKAVLAYTSGHLAPWHSLWQRAVTGERLDLSSQSPSHDTETERPAGWTSQLEREHADEPQGRRATTTKSARPVEWRPLLLSTLSLRAALLSVSLPQALKDLEEVENEGRREQFLRDLRADGETRGGLSGLLARASWAWPVAVTFQMNFRPERWTEVIARQAAGWLARATTVIAEPTPGTGRLLVFDLRGPHKAEAIPSELRLDYEDSLRTGGEALLALLGGPENTPFDRFQTLINLLEGGVISDISMGVRKTEQDVPHIIRLDELSDGEQMILGRMALFHLLEGQNDVLLMLDEPETHFNDKWKREIVNIVDGAISDTNEVLISTHSAIVLTDVFQDEIVLLEKEEGKVRRVELVSPTFGADPGDLMMRVFGAQASVGKLATEWLDSKLLEEEWPAGSMEELQRLLNQLGPGFHRSELRTILNKRKGNADSR
jgi:hypothetical protein